MLVVVGAGLGLGPPRLTWSSGPRRLPPLATCTWHGNAGTIPAKLSAPLRRVFGRYLRTEAGAPPSRAQSFQGVSALVEPRLSVVGFVPSAEAGRRWVESRVIAFPERCVACGAPVEVFARRVRRRLFRAEEVELERIPHCERHAAFGPLLMFWTLELGKDQHWTLVAPDAGVLGELLAADASKDRLPPWRAFPGSEPWSGTWRQGYGEHWRNVGWVPFWSAQDHTRRRAYLERWRGPPDWLEALLDGTWVD